jgi:Holliday junction resolvase RusA-like endonuclease
LNEIIAAAKSGRGGANAYSRLKKQWSETVWALAKSQRMLICDWPARVTFAWVEKARRRDLDNICAGAKFVLDGLVKAGVLRGDGWSAIASIEHFFDVDAKRPGVQVSLEEVKS